MTGRRLSVRAAAVFVALAVLGLQPAIGAEPTPSPSPSTDPVTIAFLNPAASYDPATEMPPRPPGTPDLPKVTDHSMPDHGYHVLVGASRPITNSIIEVSLQHEDDNEVVAGLMDPVTGRPGTYELNWDIPSDVPEGPSVMVARLYEQTNEGLIEIAHTSVDVDLQHEDDGAPADEAIELVWPSNGGRLGFYKPRGGSWQTAVDGVVTSGALPTIKLFYSTTPLGTEPEFKVCPTALGPPPDGIQIPNLPFNFLPAAAGTRKWRTSCALGLRDRPEHVTAVAAVALGGDEPGRSMGIESQEGADVHTINGFKQDPRALTLDLGGTTTFFSPSTDQPTTLRRRVGTGCIRVEAAVRDDMGRPVVGANVDLHAAGPGDGVLFIQNHAPDSKHHAAVHSPACVPAPGPQAKVGSVQNPPPTGPAAVHRVVAGPDIAHAEKTNNPTDKDGLVSFDLISDRAGVTEIIGWVDDATIPEGADTRPPDDDLQSADEVTDNLRAQWLAAPLEISMDPPAATDIVGSCLAYRVKVFSGSAPAAGVNVDIHAGGPADDLQPCAVPGAIEPRAPDRGPLPPNPPHDPASHDHASHAGTPNANGGSPAPRILHTEGETDERGNFIFGLSSPTRGIASITAWVDGEPGGDNDIPEAGELSLTGTGRWMATAGDAAVGFVNPSPFGSGTTQGTGDGTQIPAGATTTLLARVAGPSLPPEVQFSISANSGQTWQDLGAATRIEGTDVYALDWDVDKPAGPYALRAAVPETEADVRQPVTIVAPTIPGLPELGLETIDLGENAARPVTFVDRTVVMRGSASSGAEGVDLFYTKATAAAPIAGKDWIACGYVDLSGTGTTEQRFSGNCTLRPADQARQVTGLASITYDCTVVGCDATPDPRTGVDGVAPPRSPGQKEAGEAIPVIGVDAVSHLSVEPAEAEAPVGDCHRVEIAAVDQNGQPLYGKNVDVLLAGNDPPELCDPGDATQWQPADQTAIQPDPASSPAPTHLEAEVPVTGDLVLGLTSSSAGTSAIEAWLDDDADDARTWYEIADTALIHWAAPHRCSIVGTPGPDLLRGTPEADRICGLGGDDSIVALAGNDVVFAGGGDDSVDGGRGPDWIYGGHGGDSISGQRGIDTCGGGTGTDVTDCEHVRKEQ